MDSVRERFEAFPTDNINDFRNNEAITKEDMLVYAMILQEYIKYGCKNLNYEEVLHKYNETLFHILGRG